MARSSTDQVPTEVVVAGGGTAGHVLPGIAIARELVERGHAPGSVRFVGSERGIEARLVPEAGFPLTLLPGRGIQRKVSLANVGAAFGIVVGVLRAVRLVRRWRPKVVVVLGGYASVPCAVAALIWRVPVVVAEQNARAGAANRLASRWAKALPSAAGCAPPGTKTKIDSGSMSFARCTKAEKSGLATGMRTDPTISPPPALNADWNARSASWPGPKSDTMV